MHTKIRERLVAGVVLGLTVVSGLWVRSSRFVGDATWAQRLGTMLWAVALVLVLRAAWPRWSVARTGIVAIGLAFVVEFLQLTGVPRTVSGWFPPARLLLGSDFDVRDLLWLSIGVVVGAVVALGVRRVGNSVRIS